MTSNNGHDSASTASVPLKTSGAYNGGGTSQKGQTAGTDPIPDGNITGTNDHGTTNGIPNNTAVGAGINWVKIDGTGAPLQGAEFQVTRTQGGTTQYLYSNGSGWAWSGDKANAQTFQSVTSAPNGDTADNWHSLFEISGLGDGTYTVTETKVPAGCDANVLPSFQVTVKAGSPEEVMSTTASYGLVNNTPGGNPFSSKTFNTGQTNPAPSGENGNSDNTIPPGRWRALRHDLPGLPEQERGNLYREWLCRNRGFQHRHDLQQRGELHSHRLRPPQDLGRLQRGRSV